MGDEQGGFCPGQHGPGGFRIRPDPGQHGARIKQAVAQALLVRVGHVGEVHHIRIDALLGALGGQGTGAVPGQVRPGDIADFRVRFPGQGGDAPGTDEGRGAAGGEVGKIGPVAGIQRQPLPRLKNEQGVTGRQGGPVGIGFGMRAEVLQVQPEVFQQAFAVQHPLPLRAGLHAQFPQPGRDILRDDAPAVGRAGFLIQPAELTPAQGPAGVQIAEPGFLNTAAAGAVALCPAVFLNDLAQHHIPGGGYPAPVRKQQPRAEGKIPLQLGAFPGKEEGVEDKVLIRAGNRAPEGGGAEMAEHMAPAVGKVHRMAPLGASVDEDVEGGSGFGGSVGREAFALVTVAAADDDDGFAHHEWPPFTGRLSDRLPDPLRLVCKKSCS